MKGNFRPGQEFEIDGLWIRVVEGKKPAYGGGQDLRFDVNTNGWVTITFPAVGALVEGLYDNEDVLYPPTPDGRIRGGDMVFDFLWRSVHKGWQVAKATLDKQKANKRPGQAA